MKETEQQRLKQKIKRQLKQTLEKLLEIAIETKDVPAGLAVIDYLYKEELND